MDGTVADPDEWFIKLDLLNTRMTMINSAFEKHDMEMIAHILNKLPNEYSKVVTSVEGLTSLTLSDLQSKIRAFWKRKFKGEKNPKELALSVYTKFNPKPQTPNPKPQTPNPKPQTPFLFLLTKLKKYYLTPALFCLNSCSLEMLL